MYLEIYNKDSSFQYAIGSVYRRPSDLLDDNNNNHNNIYLKFSIQTSSIDYLTQYLTQLSYTIYWRILRNTE